jgi:hypothetical protein
MTDLELDFVQSQATLLKLTLSKSSRGLRVNFADVVACLHRGSQPHFAEKRDVLKVCAGAWSGKRNRDSKKIKTKKSILKEATQSEKNGHHLFRCKARARIRRHREVMTGDCMATNSISAFSSNSQRSYRLTLSIRAWPRRKKAGGPLYTIFRCDRLETK